MTYRIWSEDLDEPVRAARFARGDDDWLDSAAAVVRDLTDDQRDRLAAIGLAELVTWEHRIERDAGEPCMGELAARERHPDVLPAHDED